MLKSKNIYNSKAGFSLVEVLIAVALLAIIVIPLAMNLTSSARMNSKAKKVSAAADLSTSIIEMMQSVSLEDIMVDVNEYNSDRYGAELPNVLSTTLLQNYKINKRFEILPEGENYIPVKKQEGSGSEFLADRDVTSSILIRKFKQDDKDITKTYFTGHEDNKYSFLLSGVENEDMNVDIIATMEPQQYFDIVNIKSMAHNETIYAKQTYNMDVTIAKQYETANKMLIALKGNIQKVEDRNYNWYLDNMTRIIKISINKDSLTDAVSILIDAEYSIDDDSVAEKDKIIVKNLGSFSTNSTAEFAKGIYVYYCPMVGSTSTSKIRDSFEIINKNEFSIPVYLIAIGSDDSELPEGSLNNYKANLSVVEKNMTSEPTRTIICSNINDAMWKKSPSPNTRQITIKSLGNSTKQQTLYSVNLKVYNHRDESFDENGKFMPRSKDLLAETSGTFVDTSVKVDIYSID